MATGGEVLTMLCPEIEWTIYGNDYDSIIWHNGTAAITKKQFEDGFVAYDAWKIDQENLAKEQKASAEAKLVALGLTSEDLKVLGLA